MKLSVVVPTNRVGGFDLTFSALSNQTLDCNEWELVLVDDFRDRETLAFEYAKKFGVKNLKYLRSKPNYWRSNRLIGNARNTALCHAEGKIVVFVDDYIWFPPRFLEEHWRTYKRSPYTMVGGSKAVKYAPNQIEAIDKLPLPEVGNKIEGAFIRNIAEFKVSDTRGEGAVKDCGGQWFYTMNASAPLRKIIEVNGFCELMDCTSEEDVDMGVRLQRVGCKFWYRPSYSCTVFHMDHRGIQTCPKKYKKVSYEEVRKRGKIDSEPDEVQVVLKEMFNTKYDGSWAVIEYNRRQSPYTNIVDGKKIFDLKAEREKRGYWT